MTDISHEPALEKPRTGNRCGFALSHPRYLAWTFPNARIAYMQARARVFFEARRDAVYIGRRRWRARWRGEIHDRAPRGERAEACAAVVQVLCASLRLSDKKVIDWRTQEGLAIDVIARRAGVSRDRVKAALHDLASCGYIGQYQPRERRDGRYRGRPCVRWFTRRLLARLGGRVTTEVTRPAPAPASSAPASSAPARATPAPARATKPPIDDWPAPSGPVEIPGAFTTRR